MNRKETIIFWLLLIIIILLPVGVFVYQKQQVSDNNVFDNVPENFHAAMYYYDNVDFFPESVKIFEDFKPLSPAPRIFIVNQHILAAHLIAEQFALAADPKVKTVVLITQNNWNTGKAPIITSQYGWKTTLGDVYPANDLSDDLIAKKLATAEENIFTREHGVTGILPYIANSFPNAEIVPLVIRDGTPNEIIDALAVELSRLDLSTTAIIGSIDMSHYLPKYIADAHDRLTVQTIKTFDYDTLPRLDIDTVPTLRTIMKTAESFGYRKFTETRAINSAEIVGDPDLLVTTSYITGYFSEGISDSTDSAVHMLFVGDMMFDRGVAMYAEKNGIDSLFSKIERLFLGTHAVIGNLEGTITNEPSVSIKDNSLLRFTFNPKFAALLKKMNFSAVSLANNHGLDFGGSGYNETIKNLQANNIGYFGEPRNDTNLSTKILFNGKEVCFVGYHDLFVADPSPVISEIENIRSNCSYIVVFTHWGVEYEIQNTDRQQTLSHEFIDAGADLIIGAHPHVVQPIEIYKNKAIFYSLGNFMFDQYFSFNTEHGLAVNVEWGNEKTIFTLIPVTIKNAEVEVSTTEDGNRVLAPHIDSATLKTKQIIIWNHK